MNYKLKAFYFVFINVYKKSEHLSKLLFQRLAAKSAKKKAALTISMSL